MGAPRDGCRLKFHHFVGCQLKFSIFVDKSQLIFLSQVGNFSLVLVVGSNISSRLAPFTPSVVFKLFVFSII